MDINARICGIADAICGAYSATNPNPKRAAQTALARARQTSNPGSASQLHTAPGTTPGANPLNPYNNPSLPGYNPLLPSGGTASTVPGGAAMNPANPYNVPGLPGYNPYQPTNPASGYNAANPYNAPGLPGYNPYQPSAPQGTPYYGGGGFGGYPDYNAPTAADFGLPMSSGSGGADVGPDLSYAFSDPSAQNAIESYYDPMSQLGPWSY